MGQTKTTNQWLVPKRLSKLLLVQAIFLSDSLFVDAGHHLGAHSHPDWDTTTIHSESETNYEELDEDEIAAMRERLINNLSKGAGIPVNEEDPPPEKEDENTEDDSILDDADDDEQKEEEVGYFELKKPKKKKKHHKHGKRTGKPLSSKENQRIVSFEPEGHKEIWNDKTGQYESTFKAYIRHNQDKEEESMFDFEFTGAKTNGDVVMTDKNYNVVVALGICALIGGLVAGLIIRYMMRTYFPVEEQQQLVKVIKPKPPTPLKIEIIQIEKGKGDMEKAMTPGPDFPKMKHPFYKKVLTKNSRDSQFTAQTRSTMIESELDTTNDPNSTMNAGKQ